MNSSHTPDYEPVSRICGAIPRAFTFAYVSFLWHGPVNSMHAHKVCMIAMDDVPEYSAWIFQSSLQTQSLPEMCTVHICFSWKGFVNDEERKFLLPLSLNLGKFRQSSFHERMNHGSDCKIRAHSEDMLGHNRYWFLCLLSYERLHAPLPCDNLQHLYVWMAGRLLFPASAM
jgi:hypothetical protein